MKICPVCAARAFDDAPICYGCLHRFAEGEGGAVREKGPLAGSSAAQGVEPAPSSVGRRTVPPRPPAVSGLPSLPAALPDRPVRVAEGEVPREREGLADPAASRRGERTPPPYWTVRFELPAGMFPLLEEEGFSDSEAFFSEDGLSAERCALVISFAPVLRGGAVSRGRHAPHRASRCGGEPSAASAPVRG